MIGRKTPPPVVERVPVDIQSQFAPAGHYYSPLPDLQLVENRYDELLALAACSLGGIDFNEAVQLGLLSAFHSYVNDIDFPEQSSPSRRYYIQNEFFGHGDAYALYCFLRHFSPARVIEVGSGFSSAVMLDTAASLDLRIAFCFIEPELSRLNGLLTVDDQKKHRIINSPVQRIDPREFASLDANDILFIDSSHVAKFGSDLNFLLGAVLPILKPGVIVHFHDIFFPFEYPKSWLLEGRAWNELYMLRSFLQYNSAFEILFFSNYLAHFHQLPEPMRTSCSGSLWLRKTR